MENIIRNMTLEDKIALCEGASFWETRAFEKYGIPSMFVCDGPNGLRKQDLSGGMDMLGINKSRPATCFPAAVTTAGSWDEALLQQVGNAIGQEARDQGVGVVLGPGCNMKRNPLCGRNFEYFSEDHWNAISRLAAIRFTIPTLICRSILSNSFWLANRLRSRFKKLVAQYFAR